MFTDLLKRRNPAKEPSSQEQSPSVDGENIDPLFGDGEPFGFPDNTAENPANGLEIKDYAQRLGVSADDVWDMIEAGQVICQSRNGKLLVFDGTLGGAAATATERPVRGSAPGLPPLPDRGPRGAPETMTEMALIIDHLSLAKEENKDILRLTQDAITKITSLSDNVIALKDELLVARNEQIEQLKGQLAAKNATIAKLKQELEDLQILASTMKPSPAPRGKGSTRTER